MVEFEIEKRVRKWVEKQYSLIKSQKLVGIFLKKFRAAKKRERRRKDRKGDKFVSIFVWTFSFVFVLLFSFHH